MDEDFDLMAFDLKENDGGRQLIIAHKANPFNPNEICVITIGKGPKQQDTVTEQTTGNTSTGKQLLDGILKRFSALNKKNDKSEETNQKDSKLRFFTMLREDDGMFAIKEHVTPESVSKVARFFGIGKDEPDKIQ